MTPEKIARRRANSKRFRAAHPERVREHHRRYCAAHPNRWWKSHLWRKYGVTLERWVVWYKEGCWLCGESFEGVERRLIHVDHDHVTGENRGLAHQACNTTIGRLGEDAEKLIRIAERLKARQGYRTTQPKGEINV